jgi:hypothetical protein
MRERRLALGLTQREVVARLERHGNHTTNRALSAMENGRGLDLGLLPELAESLDCTVTYLLGLARDPQSWRPDRAVRLPVGTDGRTEPVAGNGNRPASRGAGVLGPCAPNGFAAPDQARRRVGAQDARD